MDQLFVADAAVKEAVPGDVNRYRAAGVLTWAILHQIKAEGLAEVAATGKYSHHLLNMLRASPALGYPKDERPVLCLRGTTSRLPCLAQSTTLGVASTD